MLYFLITLLQSDCFYNAGWTEDARVVFDYLHGQYPKAPLFAIGTSIGANILVSYLVCILSLLIMWCMNLLQTLLHLPALSIY